MNMNLTDLTQFNRDGLNRHQIAKAAGISWPSVDKYLYNVPNAPEEPSLVHVAAMLRAMLGDGWQDGWQSVRLGEIVEVVDDSAETKTGV
jgi:hypothetical protein